MFPLPRNRPLVHLGVALVCGFSFVSSVAAEGPSNRLREPVYRPDKSTTGPRVPNQRPTPPSPRVAVRDNLPTVARKPHPLDPLLQLMTQSLDNVIHNVVDYKATLVKREQVDGELLDYEYLFMKVRHERRDPNGQIVTPLGVYLRFEAPKKIAGREVLWIKGENNGKMIAHEGGLLGAFSVWLKPDSAVAMRGQRYPVTNIGIEMLLSQLIDRVNQDMRDENPGNFDVREFHGAKVDGRSCTCIQVTHPVRQPQFDYYRARIFVDNELNVPIRFAAWDWPVGKRAAVLEEYTYRNLQLNVNLTDADFNHDNESYEF